MVLAFQMRAGQRLATGRRALAEDVGDAVDGGVEAGLAHAAHEPFARGDVLLGQRWAMHARLVGAEGGERAQVGQHALRLDVCHATGSDIGSK